MSYLVAIYNVAERKEHDDERQNERGDDGVHQAQKTVESEFWQQRVVLWCREHHRVVSVSLGLHHHHVFDVVQQ